MALFEVEGWNLEGKRVAHGISLSETRKKKRKERKDKRKLERREKYEQALASGDKHEETIEEMIEEEDGAAVTNKRKRPADSDDKETQETKKSKKEVESATSIETAISAPPKMATENLTPLQKKMLNKLSGSRFRWINEQLYTTDSEKALEMMKKQPELFDEYHKGFQSQVEAWPENPVDLYIKQLIFKGVNRAINSPGGLPGLEIRGKKTVVVADMGCGEAKLAEEVNKFMEFYQKDSKKALKVFKKKYGGNGDISSKNKKLYFDIHSFDLKKVNDRITVADIKHVPMEDQSCSVVIFCLALMGTNFLDFIKEAERILIPRGELWIAEIQSRLADEKGEEFSSILSKMGFKHKETDNSNRMFTRFEFFKPVRDGENELEEVEEMRKERKEGEWLLKPCIYKRR
ncbi:DEKNAAC103326 [Brettanomyces naardenensis]|uniref:Ribosomal RNA-processing protein 8 n=1 Tax=Brettanomyces naardenensis TaxID=13370 RepID=A0A448YNL5_BRENA|nr:DEKNAAC103326 [Brettanomyces naardenensis]